jgi:hypothetical protein
MRKYLSAIILVMLLASCAPVNQPAKVDATVSSNGTTLQTAENPAASPSDLHSRSPLPTNAFVSSDEGENVSETFHTGDLKRFFMLSSKELCALLGSSYEERGQTIVLRSPGISFEYRDNTDDNAILLNNDPDEEPLITLQSIVLTSFDFRGLDSSSNFEEVKKVLGETELSVLHKEKDFYYVLRYRIGDLQFDFFSIDEKSAGGITLALMPLSESKVNYRSCGTGQKVSKTLTTDDIKLFLKLSPEELDSKIGNGWSNFDEDTGAYSIYFEYLGVGFSYPLEEAEKGDDYIAYPVSPLACVWIDGFDYCGLNHESSFEEIIKVLGKRQILEIPILDTSYFALRYKIDGVLFEFSSSDKKSSDGISLRIITR